MRIPPSVIVMSLLTAAPFALAIRDTVNAKPMPLDEYGLDDYSGREYSARESRRDRELLEEYEREMERERKEQAEARKANLKRLDTLFGADKASMGPFFAGFALGTPLSDHLEAKADLLEDEFLSPILGGDTTLDSVAVVVTSRDYDYSSDSTTDACDTLRDKLTTAWGPSVNGVWLNPTTHQRASLDTSICKLSFEKYVDAADWIAALPVDVVGMTEAKAAAKLGGLVDAEQGDFEWTMPGLGHGKGVSNVYAYVYGTVKTLTVTADTDFDTLVQVRDALSAKLKEQPKRDEYSGDWVWKKKPGYRLAQDAGSNQFNLIVGKDTE